MLVAMAILAFLMLTLFRFFSNMQLAWSSSMNTTELYENGRVALDVITRDLQSAVARANDIPGQHIQFHQPDSQSVWFVTVSDPAPGAFSSLVEVGYRLQNNRFERAVVDDTNAAWNIYGARDDADDQDGYGRVIDGVINQAFVCSNSSLAQIQPNQATQLPHMISVKLTLMDTKSFKLWQRLSSDQKTQLERKVSRTFLKTVFLGNRANP